MQLNTDRWRRCIHVCTLLLYPTTWAVTRHLQRIYLHLWRVDAVKQGSLSWLTIVHTCIHITMQRIATLNPSLPWLHLKMTRESAKCETLFVFFFTLARERISIEMCTTENRCYRTRKYTVCRLVCASFSPEVLQAGAVMGLNVALVFLLVLVYCNTAQAKEEGNSVLCQAEHGSRGFTVYC